MQTGTTPPTSSQARLGVASSFVLAKRREGAVTAGLNGDGFAIRVDGRFY